MTAKSEQKEKTHASILESAERLVRARGIAGARVADVMKGAGLTVGGFYAHFASKESLVDEIIRRTSSHTRSRLFAGLEDKAEKDRARLVLERYLSGAHRDEREEGCPFPAIVGEVATAAPEHRDVLSEQISAFASELGSLLPSADAPERRHLALGLFALMYGGLALARALRGTPLSDEVLRACRSIGRKVVSR
jgi:TetR/AcrR family transcriptional regulator, transcriptional repressor for nem operon